MRLWPLSLVLMIALAASSRLHRIRHLRRKHLSNRLLHRRRPPTDQAPSQPPTTPQPAVDGPSARLASVLLLWDDTISDRDYRYSMYGNSTLCLVSFSSFFALISMRDMRLS